MGISYFVANENVLFMPVKLVDSGLILWYVVYYRWIL